MDPDLTQLFRRQVKPYETLVFLVRHAQTAWNKEQRFQGQLDVPLSNEGTRQAELLGDRLKLAAISFDAIYSSDLARAFTTAQIIGQAVGVSPKPIPELREINCGEWQGKLASDIAAHQPELLERWRTVVSSSVVLGGESLIEVQDRTFTFYKSVVSPHAGAAIVLVSHGAALVALLAAILETDLAEEWQSRRLKLDNTGVTVVAQDLFGGKARLIVSNARSHPSSLDAPEAGLPA